MVVSHPRPPLLPPLLLLKCALGLPATREENRKHASQVPSALVNDNSTAVRHTLPVGRQHCREHLGLFRKMPVYLLPVCQVTQQYFPLLRAHGLLCHLLQILTA